MKVLFSAMWVLIVLTGFPQCVCPWRVHPYLICQGVRHGVFREGDWAWRILSGSVGVFLVFFNGMLSLFVAAVWACSYLMW